MHSPESLNVKQPQLNKYNMINRFLRVVHSLNNHIREQTTPKLTTAHRDQSFTLWNNCWFGSAIYSVYSIIIYLQANDDYAVMVQWPNEQTAVLDLRIVHAISYLLSVIEFSGKLLHNHSVKAWCENFMTSVGLLWWNTAFCYWFTIWGICCWFFFY